ncbi:MAG: FHA domain-containing protein [Gammaproteobacteria bacterium]|nr:FHA domain-containing protein [Gammaproteobacteria bacterium]MDE0274089.1 FHA domain-containing protein [Gammaproteobacteria bacterium]
MSNAEQVWKIKILSGFHAGAELVLPDEVQALGRGVECDLVLDDPSLAETHIGLTPLASSLRLRLLDQSAPTYVDGQPVQGEVDLAPLQVVTVGTVHIAVGPAGEAWPKIEIPTLPVASPEEVPEKSAEESENQPTDEEQPPQEPTAPQRASAPTSQRKPEQLLRRLVAAAVGAAALIVVALIWLGGPTEVERSEPEAEEVLLAIQEIASRLGAQVRVDLPDSPTGLPTVTGFLRRDQDRMHFEKALQEASILANTRLTSNGDILRSVRALINEITAPGSDTYIMAAPSPDTPGHIILTGYVETDQILERLRRLLELEVRTHSGLTFLVENQDHREAILQERLSELQLRSELYIQDLDKGIALFGPAPNPQEMARLKVLVDEFNHEFNSRPFLRLPGTSTFLGKSTIELEYRALVLGDDRNQLITRKGEARTVGDTIMGNWTIWDIDPRYVILEQASEIGSRQRRLSPSRRAYFVVEESFQS